MTRRSADRRQPLAQEIQVAGGQAGRRSASARTRKEEGVIALVERIERDIAPIKVTVFHMGANVPCSLPKETSRKYFQIWEMACFSAFFVAKEVAKRMVVRGHGTIPFTGAMATRLGSANFAAFPGTQVRAARVGAKHGA